MLIDLKLTLITKSVIGYNEKNKCVHVQVVSAALTLIQWLLPSSNCKIPFTIYILKKTHYFREGIILILYVSQSWRNNYIQHPAEWGTDSIKFG